MNVSWTIIIFLFRLLEISDGDGNKREDCPIHKALMLNGHYVRWPSHKMSEYLIKDWKYIPKNIIYTRFQLYGNNVFLAAPRYKYGVPFTMGRTFLNDERPDFDAFVGPYPCADNTGATKSSCAVGKLVNVVDLVMDSEGILWVLDIGVSNTLSEYPSTDDQPKVIGFDVATGNIKHTISLQSLHSNIRSHYQYLAVERMKGGRTILYVGDIGKQSIIVWDVLKNEGTRLKLPQTIDKGSPKIERDDVFQMALVKHEARNYLYFTFTSSRKIFRIRTKNLRDREFVNPKCIVSIGKKPGKMVFVGVGYESIVYFRLYGLSSLYSWDTKSSLIEDNIKLVRKGQDYRTITHVDVDDHGILWIMESNIRDFVKGRTGSYGPSVVLTPVTDDPVPITNEFGEL